MSVQLLLLLICKLPLSTLHLQLQLRQRLQHSCGGGYHRHHHSFINHVEKLIPRSNVVATLLSIFSEDSILSYDVLDFAMVDHNGDTEDGRGEGVLREAFSLFFQVLYDSYMIGSPEKVSLVRCNMSREDWESVTRILLCGLRKNFFPTYLSPLFITYTLFGEEMVENHHPPRFALQVSFGRRE